MTETSDLVLKIGEYQLRNLLHNRVGFLFLDLRDPALVAPADAGGRSHGGLLAGSRSVAPADVLSHVREQGVAPNGPIVLICETGAKSMAAALELAGNSFINVFVVEGGIAALPQEH